MTPDTETQVAVKDQLPSGMLQRARALWLRFGYMPARKAARVDPIVALAT